ncbi:hypothetical protein CDFC105_43926 [Clostridioides difficile]|nr:hypothetical protein CDFC105_43926 [Clostridioides difficile]
MLGSYVFFFFKQKTAYEIMPSLVGSEMCIRDRFTGKESELEAERLIYGNDFIYSRDITRFSDVVSMYLKTVSYTHLRAHETRHDLVCRLLLEKKKCTQH